MDGRCVSCKHWKRVEGKFESDYQAEYFGGCSSDKFVYIGDGQKAALDGLGYWDYESYSAGFGVSENFGCVHWTARDQ